LPASAFAILTCEIAPVEPICSGDSVSLDATISGGTPPYVYEWGGGIAGGTFIPSNDVEDPIWTSPIGFTGTNTLSLWVNDAPYMNDCGVYVDVVVNPCEPTAKYIPLPDDFNTSILARVGELFTDLSPFVASIGIGLPVAFWGVRKGVCSSKSNR